MPGGLLLAGVFRRGSDCVSDDLGDQQFDGVGQGRHPPLMKDVLGVESRAGDGGGQGREFEVAAQRPVL